MSTATLNHKQAFQFLTEDQLRKQVPCIFTTKPSERTSAGKVKIERYKHKEYQMTSTVRIIKDLEKEGWYPNRATQMRAKLAKNEGYQKHFLHFRNPKLFVGTKNSITDLPEIVVVNSYDGRCGLKLYGGLYRVVCSNGLIVKSKSLSSLANSNDNENRGFDYDHVRITHNSDKLNAWKEIYQTVLANAHETIDWINVTKAVTLSQEQEQKFAKLACRARWDHNYHLRSTKSLLERVREQDHGSDFYTVFNVVQEKLINGGFKGVGDRLIKPLKNPDRELMTNRKLFQVAEEFLSSI